MKSEMVNQKDFSNETNIYFEHHVSYEGYGYTIIFGHHINGGFICIPNWGWGCEVSNFCGSVGYNTNKLVKAGVPEDVARKIAIYIDEWLITNKNKEVEKEK